METRTLSLEGTGRPGESPGTNQRVLHAIRRIIHAADLYSKRLALEFGVTTPQLLCLEEITANGATMIRSVARELHLSASTMVGIVDRLEAKGLARRERTSPDRRKVTIVATEAGKALVARAPSALQSTLAQALQTLPPDELAGIAGVLEKIVDLMERGTEPLGGMETGAESAGGVTSSADALGAVLEAAPAAATEPDAMRHKGYRP